MKKEYDSVNQLGNILSEWKIRFGVPLLDKKAALEDKFYSIDVPLEPHIFFSRKLRLQEEGKTIQELNEALVILGHAHIWGEGIRDWKFATGKPVLDTLMAYEDIANQFGFPQVDAVLACRNTSEALRNNTVIPNFPRGKYPYVFPIDGDAVIHKSSTLKGEIVSWAKPGEGVGLLIADAGKWANVEQWKQKANRILNIPSWAKAHR